MASVWYPKAKQALMNKEIDLNSDDIRAILVDTSQYTYSAAHDFLDDVASGARQAVSGALQSPTIVDGVFDAADITITGGIAATAEAIIIYRHTGTDGTSHLLLYIDAGTGLPIPVTAADITLRWHSSGIGIL